MKILLAAVNAKYTHMNPALYSIKAYAGVYGEQMEIVEYTINQFPQDVLRDLYSRKPDVIGFSVYIWNTVFVEKLLPDLQKILPEVQIFLGGPEAAFRKEELLSKYPSVKGVFFGEGEEAWKQAAEQLTKNGRISEPIAGLLLRNSTAAAPEILSMDDLPFLYTEENIGLFENRMLYYETSRGCPYRCSYCLSSVEKVLRFKRLEKVYAELNFFLRHRVRIVKFVDRTFNADRKHAMGIWQYLAAHDNGVTRFHFEIEADLITDDELAFLKTVRKGLFQFEIGVQSTDPAVLHEIERFADTKKIKKVVTELKKADNIMLHTDLIAGLPREDLSGFIRSFNEVYTWGADELQLGFLKVLPGTVMQEKKDQYGLQYETEAPYEVFSTNWLSYEDIVLLKAVEEQLERYGNSGAYRRTLAAFLRCFEDPFSMFCFLADYYSAHTGRFEKQSRVSSYQMLREAIREKLLSTENAETSDKTESPSPLESGLPAVEETALPSALKYYDALLLTDLYEKEKMKVRPAFFGGNERQHQLEKEYVRVHEITENVHIEFFDFDPEAFMNTGEKVMCKTAVLFFYDVQGAAERIEYRKEGTV